MGFTFHTYPQRKGRALRVPLSSASGREYAGLPRLQSRLAEVGEGNFLGKSKRRVLWKLRRAECRGAGRGFETTR